MPCPFQLCETQFSVSMESGIKWALKVCEKLSKKTEVIRFSFYVSDLENAKHLPEKEIFYKISLTAKNVGNKAKNHQYIFFPG